MYLDVPSSEPLGQGDIIDGRVGNAVLVLNMILGHFDENSHVG